MNRTMNFTVNQKDFLDDLSALLAIKSTKDMESAREGAPFGPGPLAALEKMLELGQREGFRTKNLQGYAGYIEYGPEEAEDYIAVIGHVDVVPATGKWTHDPFTAYVEDGTLYARGAIDDKGPTMAAFYALKALKDSGAKIRNRIRLVIGTDEESGCACMVKYNELEPMSLFGFAPDAEFPLIYAEKGRIHTRIDLPAAEQEAAVHLSEFYSGERINMVPDRAFAVLTGTDAGQWLDQAKKTLKEKNVACSDEKTEKGFKLTVKGQSAHGSEPAGGINAAFLLASVLVNVPFPASEKAFISFLAETLNGDFAGERLGIAFSDDISGELTVNAGLVRYNAGKGGSVSLDVRCPVKASLEKIAETLTNSVEKLGFSIGELGKTAPLYVDPNHPGVQILKKVYEARTGQKNVKLLTSGGGTYAQFLDAGVAYGACMPGYPYTGHQVDEHVRVDDLLLASSIYADAMVELANMEKIRGN
ncbi:dipeptidase PepV [Sporolactobacillus sp. THM7-4]|nr:dipeptidase PepV [Sporolactobacillus sp. THM7-4]